MKKIIFSLLLFFIFVTIQAKMPNTSYINKLINDIKSSRYGLNYNKLSILQDPFEKNSTKQSKKRVLKTYNNLNKKRDNKSDNLSFKLEAIVDKSVKINKKWINLGEKIQNYTLKKISKNYVILQKKLSNTITIYLNKKETNINLKVKKISLKQKD